MKLHTFTLSIKPIVLAYAAILFTQSASADQPLQQLPPQMNAHTLESPKKTANDLFMATHLSFHEPMYFLAGVSERINSKFQLSFKFRLFQPDDIRSRHLLDNLYAGYTQLSLWDLNNHSTPIRDTNYRPSLYYAIPDFDATGTMLNGMSLATGIEHESNGRDGVSSRSINIAFIAPGFLFGKQNDTHLTITPKIYTYLEKSDNPDIADYRGHLDLRMTLDKPDSFSVSMTLRKGTRAGKGSIDTLLSYPLERIFQNAVGYVTVGYFYGYGESPLYYNQKGRPQFRVGYSLQR